MRRQEDLQLKLRERYRRLLVADMNAYLPLLKVIREFIKSEPALTALLVEAGRSEPNLDLNAVVDGLGASRHSPWTHTTEGGQAAQVWRLVEAIADGVASDRILWNVYAGGSNNINDHLRAATENILAPLFDYLIERVADQSSVLHALDRYVRLVEWFDRDRLIAAYDADTARGEAVYNAHLRRFLFKEGIDLPFTEAQSPSGESDALAGLHNDDPLVCEVKVFDGQSRGRRKVATGLHQAVQYAQDYGKSEAYLVIFNVSGYALGIDGDGDDKQWPPYFDLSGVRVYVASVRARRLASASKSGPTKDRRFGRSELTDPDLPENN